MTISIDFVTTLQFQMFSLFSGMCLGASRCLSVGRRIHHTEQRFFLLRFLRMLLGVCVCGFVVVLFFFFFFLGGGGVVLFIVCLFVVVVVVVVVCLCQHKSQTPSTGYDILPPRKKVPESDARSVHKDKKLRYI